MIGRATWGLVVAAVLAGCGHPLRDKGTAADAMDRFHERFNAGEYGKIYDTAGSEFQSNNVRWDFLTLLDAAKRAQIVGGVPTLSAGTRALNCATGLTSSGATRMKPSPTQCPAPTPRCAPTASTRRH